MKSGDAVSVGDTLMTLA
ncbi:hypothetical protein LEA05_23035 [Salmonella enterica]|nr:hypothetical protein [Salmonella enterica]